MGRKGRALFGHTYGMRQYEKARYTIWECDRANIGGGDA